MSYRFALLIAGLALITGRANAAATYYVDPVNGRDTYTGTSATVSGSVGPWQSVAKVQGVTLQPGDQVLFKAGSTFTGGLTITRSGSSASPITFGRYGSGNAPIFKKGRNHTDDGTDHGDWASAVEVQANYVVLDSLQMQDSQYAGARLNAGTHHVTVRYCYMTNVGIGVLIEDSNSNTVANNSVVSPHMVVNTPKSYNPDDDFGANGIMLSGSASNNVITRNAFIHCEGPSYDYGNDGGAVEIYAGSPTATIDNNRIVANRMDTCVGVLEVGGQSGTLSNLYFAYNVCYRNGVFAYFHTDGNFAIHFSGVRMDNNTVVEPDNYRSVRALITYSSPLPDYNQMTWRNNIFYVGNFSVIAVNFNCIHYQNDFYRVNPAATQYGIGSGSNLNPSNNNNIDADPRFVTLSGGSWVFGDQNFHLQTTSPCRNTGTDLRYEGYTTDYASITLYVGSPDRGAYEQ